MNRIDELMKELHLDTELSAHDIPVIDLYMDQVIQLFENKFKETKRFPEEKILTKTMINNYSKGKLFFPIKNKKYSREHVMLINMIYEMKTVLSIRDIKHSLRKLNHGITAEDVDVEQLYENYLKISRDNLEQFKNNSIEISNAASELSDALPQDNDMYIEKLMLILSFVNMSNYYRRAAEKIIDQIENSETKKD